MRMGRASGWLILGLAGWVSACESRPDTRVVEGSPAVSTGSSEPAHEAVLDFGEVELGKPVSRELLIHNVGRGALTLSSVQGLEDETIARMFGGLPSEPLQLGASETRAITLEFTPPLDAALDESGYFDAHATLVLNFEGAAEGEASVLVHLVGRGVVDTCGRNERLNFGELYVGESRTLSLFFRNASAQPITVKLGEIESNSGSEEGFLFGDGYAAGEFELAGSSGVQVPVSFAPNRYGDFVAFMRTNAGPGCPDRVVTLLGREITKSLWWSNRVNCGGIHVGGEEFVPVRFINTTSTSVTLFDPRLDSPHFEFDEDLHWTTPFEVPADGGIVWRVLRCAPKLLGSHEGSLRFQTTLPSVPSGEIRLSVRGE